jgi:2-keto-3-deoxy-L-rhamnonate aldolase RhmA
MMDKYEGNPERAMKENSIRRAVREGRAALGTGLKEFASRGVPWIIEAAGFDYCAIDHEHGAFDMETIANLASWFQATNVSPIVRLHKSFAHLIPGILDQGIMGIQVSEVENAEEARAIVRLAKYPPIGNRGISGQGPHTGYKSYGPRHATEYAPWANENIIIFPSIESLDGLENVEKIAAVKGVDVIHVGSNDLLVNMGKPGKFDDPAIVAAQERCIAAAKAHGKFAGIGGNRDVERQAAAVKKGCLFVTTQSDIGFLSAAANAWTSGVRKGVKS